MTIGVMNCVELFTNSVNNIIEAINSTEKMQRMGQACISLHSPQNTYMIVLSRIGIKRR